jgi:hypothetical protein
MKKILLMMGLVIALNGCYSETEVKPSCDCAILVDKWEISALFIMGFENVCTGKIVNTDYDVSLYDALELGDMYCNPIVNY